MILYSNVSKAWLTYAEVQIVAEIFLTFGRRCNDMVFQIFFLLRKKNNQISFLHVYHHGGMTILCWLMAKFIGGGHTMFVTLINSTVHVCMYFYYLLSVWNKEYKKSIWWKKHITELQLVSIYKNISRHICYNNNICYFLDTIPDYIESIRCAYFSKRL